ncbi:hypothetical protein GQ457_18G014890 [Hibiscus cannabinus]
MQITSLVEARRQEDQGINFCSNPCTKYRIQEEEYKTLTLSSLISSKYSLDVFHELMNKLNCKAPRSNRQALERTPSAFG